MPVDFNGRRDESEITRRRLPQGKYTYAFFFNLNITLIDYRIVANYLAGEFRISLYKGSHGLINRLFHERA
jgi:hypothetical protein